MEIDEYIYCHTTAKFSGTEDVFAYKGKKYKVSSKNDERIWFMNESENEHCWPLYDNETINQFHKYFSTIPIILTEYKIKNHTFNL